MNMIQLNIYGGGNFNGSSNVDIMWDLVFKIKPEK